MRTLYRSNPSFLPLFSLLTQWARGLGIIRSASLDADSGRCSGDSQVLMKSGFLHALIIHILQIIESDEDQREMAKERRENSRVRKRKRDIGIQDEYDLIGLDDDDTEDDDDDDYDGGEGEEEMMPSLMSKSLSKTCAHHTDNDSPYDVPDFDYLTHANECSPLHLARLMVTFFRFGSQLKDEFCFIWPVPGRPEHKLDTAIIADFAEHCARSYQTLAYSGSWTSIIDKSGYSDDFPFSLELPESITDVLSRNAFMALKLQTLSKVIQCVCVSVCICVCVCMCVCLCVLIDEFFRSPYPTLSSLPCLFSHALFCTYMHCTALHCTALHCTTPHYTTQHNTTLHYTALHYTTLNHIILKRPLSSFNLLSELLM